MTMDVTVTLIRVGGVASRPNREPGVVVDRVAMETPTMTWIPAGEDANRPRTNRPRPSP